MVDFIVLISSFAIVSCFVILAAFIARLQWAIHRESSSLRFRKAEPTPMSKVDIPFRLKPVNEISATDELSITLQGKSVGYLTYYTCVPKRELHKACDPQHRAASSRKKNLSDILTLLSSWSSPPKEFHFKEDWVDEVKKTFQYSCLPTDVKEHLLQIIKGDTGDELFLPFVVLLQVREHEKQNCLLNSSIISILTAFTVSDQKKYEVFDQYIETVDERVYRIKDVFESGIAPENATDDNSSADVSENCIVCHDNPVTRVIIPCRHSCVCKACFQKISVCPICRTRVESFFIRRDESMLPVTEEEERHQVSDDISNMGFWNFLKSVWNAS